MTGSSLAPVIIPIVVSLSLAAWLIIVYYAARHPLWKDNSPAPGQAPAPGHAPVSEHTPVSEHATAPGHNSAGQASAPAVITSTGSDQFHDDTRPADRVLAHAGTASGEPHPASS